MSELYFVLMLYIKFGQQELHQAGSLMMVNNETVEGMRFYRNTADITIPNFPIINSRNKYTCTRISDQNFFARLVSIL